MVDEKFYLPTTLCDKQRHNKTAAMATTTLIFFLFGYEMLLSESL